LIFSLIVIVSICFTACDITNPIIGQWWVEEEPEYIPLFKYIPQISYETMVQEEIVYKTVFVQLPPETITEYVYEQLPPEIIYETIEVIKEVPEYITVYQNVIQYIQTPPDKDSIINWLKDPANAGDVSTIINIIKTQIDPDDVKNIINQIPPEEIINYLTNEQIQYIVSQQPTQRILQSIKIISIEYVLFAGDSSTVNGPHGQSAQTDLTDQEKAYNLSVINGMAQLLKDEPNYIIMLHGHANPVTFTDGERSDLTILSNSRAADVRRVLMADYNIIDGNQPADYENPNLKDRVSCSGYGGERVLFGNNSPYTALNRRVEMILFEIVTTVE